MATEIAARMRGITKSFGGRVVLGPIDLDIRAGEFVALLGPNGAGKSTLIKVLDGVYRADRGEVDCPEAPDGALSVGVVHQDLGLIESMTVLDNLRLGHRARRRPLGYLDRAAERRVAGAALERFGLDFDLDARVHDLAPSERALLAVARVAADDPKLIILDETTSVLSSVEAQRLVQTLVERAPSSISFVMVTHKLAEALALASRVIVLRDGQVVCDRELPLPTLAEVTDLLAPDGIVLDEDAARGARDGEPMLELRDVRCGGVGPLNLTVYRGEAVAITGRLGSILPTVGYLAAGVIEPDSGSVVLAQGARRAIVTPNREREGNLPELTVRENMTLSSLRRWRSRGVPVLRLTRERAAARDSVASLAVVPNNHQAKQRTLSGGNQQKVMFARALMTESEVYILCEPTRGVDIATRRQIYALMSDMKRRGCAVLVVAADPQDVLAVSDRILVLNDGQIVSESETEHLSTEELARLV